MKKILIPRRLKGTNIPREFRAYIDEMFIGHRWHARCYFPVSRSYLGNKRKLDVYKHELLRILNKAKDDIGNNAER